MGDAIKYLNALTLAAAAIAMRWLLIPLVGPDAPYATILGAVALTVWLWGWGPAVVTAGVGLIGTGLIIAGRSAPCRRIICIRSWDSPSMR